MQPWMSTIEPLLSHESAIKPVRAVLANYLIDHDTFAARKGLKNEGLLEAVEPVLDDVLHSLRGDRAYRLYRALLLLVRRHTTIFQAWGKSRKRVSPAVWASVKNRFPDVRPGMLRVTWRSLSEINRARVLKEALDERFTLRTAKPVVVSDLAVWLSSKAKRIAYRKLRFLAENDGGMSLEDFQSELTHYAIRSFKESEFLEGSRGQPNADYMRNYGLQAMHNRALSIIQERQTMKRACLVRMSEDNGSKVAEYQRTVLALDRRPSGGSHVSTRETYTSQADVIPMHEPTEDQVHVAQVRKLLNSIERRVVDTYLGTRIDPQWEAWAEARKIPLHEPHDPRVLAGLCAYHGIELADLQRAFKPCEPDPR